jgi:hypothetical protein
MIETFIALLLICVVAGLFYWAIGALGTPDPIARFARVGIVLIAALFIIYLVFGAFGHGHLGLGHGIGGGIHVN